jgi:hypothetical protein
VFDGLRGEDSIAERKRYPATAYIHCEWQGVFANEEVWEMYLIKSRIHRFNEPNDIPDNVLLEIYHNNYC